MSSLRMARAVVSGLLLSSATSIGIEVGTGDGLALEFAADGRVTAASVAGERLPTLSSAGGFYVTDMMQPVANLLPVRAVGVFEAVADGGEFTGSAPGLGIELTASIRAGAGHISVDGRVRDVTGQDRGLRVAFALPLDAGGWTWWDDIAEHREIAAGAHYAHYGQDWSVGRGRQVSVLPFASVAGGGQALALAQRMEHPRFFRIFYDSRHGYCIDYNLGLAPDTAKFPSSASFHFVVYRHDPAWGLRAAAQRYYDLFPEHFRVRVRRQGLYCHRVPVDLPNPEDFGFCFDLSGFFRPERKVLQDQGIYLLVHPMGTEAHLRWPADYEWRTKNSRPSLTQIEDIFLTARPEYKAEPSWRGITQRYLYASFEDNRQRVVNSAVHGPDGRFRTHAYNEVIEFIATSTDPELPSPNMAEGERGYRIGRHIATATKAGSEIDGVDFDNIGITAGRTRENFRREHFATIDHPLIYDARTRRVCIQTGISFYEFVKSIADEMHHQGKLCTGNCAQDTHTQTFFGHLLDKHGGEIQYHAPTRNLRVYRLLAYQKPVSHIIYSGAVAAGQAETVMHRWLAFGEFPAITELGYSGTSSDLEKGRPLYRRFMPVMQRIAYAGWEPITHASVTDDAAQPPAARVVGAASTVCGPFFVERFGNWQDGDLHFTVHNDSDRPASGWLLLDKKALGVDRSPAWVEMLSKGIAGVDRAGALSLDPHRTKVFAVFDPEHGTLPWWRGKTRLEVTAPGEVVVGESTVVAASVSSPGKELDIELSVPSGWRTIRDEERSARWLLTATEAAQPGQLRVSADVTQRDGKAIHLVRVKELRPMPALELVTRELGLTLDVPYTHRIAVRNNTTQPRPVDVRIRLPDGGGVDALEGSAEIGPSQTEAVKLRLAVQAKLTPGRHQALALVNGRKYPLAVTARRGLSARRTPRAPIIDGTLDEWPEPSSSGSFRLLSTGERASQQTDVWLAYDDDALYVALRCWEDRIAELKSVVVEPDGPVWQDDDAAVFIDPGASRGTFYQMEVNARGTMFDSRNSDSTWSGNVTVRATVGVDCWRAEFMIPWKTLGMTPAAGERWGINIGRQEKPHAETSSITTTFKKVAQFADLVFE